MAKENIKKFFDEVSKSEDLQKQLTAAIGNKSAEEQAAVVADMAKKAGFDFTAQEMIEEAAGDKKLDVDELDAVAGGGHSFCVTIALFE